MDTSKGIISLIPGSLDKENMIKTIHSHFMCFAMKKKVFLKLSLCNLSFAIPLSSNVIFTAPVNRTTLRQDLAAVDFSTAQLIKLLFSSMSQKTNVMLTRIKVNKIAHC